MKFLLKRAIGQFLATELDVANLDVELGEGRVVLKDLALNMDVSFFPVAINRRSHLVIGGGA